METPAYLNDRPIAIFSVVGVAKMDHCNPGPAPQVDLEVSGLVILAGPVVVRPPVEVVGIGVGEADTGIVG